MIGRKLLIAFAGLVFVSCLCIDASACCFRRRRSTAPVQYVYIQQPVYQLQTVQPTPQSQLTPLNPLPQLPATYFPTQEP